MKVIQLPQFDYDQHEESWTLNYKHLTATVEAVYGQDNNLPVAKIVNNETGEVIHKETYWRLETALDEIFEPIREAVLSIEGDCVVKFYGGE